MAEEPNEAPPRNKPKGHREQASGISNRPLDEETANQESLPDSGESRPGAHAGRGHTDADTAKE